VRAGCLPGTIRTDSPAEEPEQLGDCAEAIANTSGRNRTVAAVHCHPWPPAGGSMPTGRPDPNRTFTCPPWPSIPSAH